IGFQPGDQSGGRIQTHDGNEAVEADIVEDPQSRIRNPAEGAIGGTQVATDQASQERTDARAQTQWDTADMDCYCADKGANDHGHAHERYVRLGSGTIGVAKEFGGSLDLLSGAEQRQYIVTL